MNVHTVEEFDKLVTPELIVKIFDEWFKKQNFATIDEIAIGEPKIFHVNKKQ